MKMQNIQPSVASVRLGFHLSPDITIEYVKPKSETINLVENVPVHRTHGEEEDELLDPVVFCAITMDDEERNDEISRINEHNLGANLVSVTNKILKKSTKNPQSNENSSFVCNGGTRLGLTKPRKRFSCHICQKTFGWTTDLKRHILIHTGERPFKCTLCFATFTRNFLLQKHKTKIHQCLSPNEVSQLNNNVARNLMEIKLKMKELEGTRESSLEADCDEEMA